jgi:aminoglycoside phosphotransferase (APT) family kinase protein
LTFGPGTGKMPCVDQQLADYLAARLAVPELTIRDLQRIYGGASRETWMFTACWETDGGPREEHLVLRKDPPASLLESDREIEYAFYSAYQDTEVPVPRMRWLENDPSHLGSPFFIMDRILDCEGGAQRILEPDYDDIRAKIGRRHYEILADVHRRDWRGSPITEVIDAPAPEDCWKRELDHWERVIDENELTPQPIARAAIRWLRANPPPPPERVTVVHGDYRVGNFLYRHDGGIYGIVDWEMAHLGDPIEDIAWSFMEAWEWARNGLKGGIIDAEEAIAAYERASGTKVDREALHWWDVFSGVKGQGIWLTGAKSYQDQRTPELVLAMTSYWLCNFQDEILLRSMGRGA